MWAINLVNKSTNMFDSDLQQFRIHHNPANPDPANPDLFLNLKRNQNMKWGEFLCFFNPFCNPGVRQQPGQ